MPSRPYRLPDCNALLAIHPDGARILTIRPRTAPVCEMDGIPLHKHARCRLCNVLIGPAHVRRSLSPGGYCVVCDASLKRKEGKKE